MSSFTRSVIRETVSAEADAPCTSAKWALISPVVSRFVYSDNTTLSISRQPPLSLLGDDRG